MMMVLFLTAFDRLWSAAYACCISCAFCFFCLACASTQQSAEQRTTASNPPPSYTVYRIANAITVDGKLDEHSWQAAAAVELVHPVTGAAPKQRTHAKLLWSDSLLYVAFESSDTNVLAQFSRRDETLWKDDVVELFIAAGGLEETFGGYVEIEVNPRGSVLDLFALRAEGDAAQSLPYDIYNLNIQSAAHIRGTLNDSTDVDAGWTVEFAVPLRELRRLSQPLPRNGERWRANLLRINYSTLDPATSLLDRELSAWSPTGKSRFHVPERFGELIFSTTSVQDALHNAANNNSVKNDSVKNIKRE